MSFADRAALILVVMLAFGMGVMFGRALWRRESKKDEAARAVVAAACEGGLLHYKAHADKDVAAAIREGDRVVTRLTRHR